MLISAKINNGINGSIKIPGDKSISHRAIIIPSISIGTTEITNLLMSEDVINTLKAFSVLITSVDINKFEISVVPLEIDGMIIALWEMDLSPGILILPFIPLFIFELISILLYLIN